MAYFMGEALDRKLAEFGLTDIAGYIVGVADGSFDWPIGGFIISAPPALFELVRTLLYSIMHRHGLKELFKVKANYKDDTLLLDMRHQPGQQKRIGVERARAGGPSASFSRPSAPPAQPDDFSFLSDESLTFDGEKK